MPKLGPQVESSQKDADGCSSNNLPGYQSETNRSSAMGNCSTLLPVKFATGSDTTCLEALGNEHTSFSFRMLADLDNTYAG